MFEFARARIARAIFVTKRFNEITTLRNHYASSRFRGPSKSEMAWRHSLARRLASLVQSSRASFGSPWSLHELTVWAFGCVSHPLRYCIAALARVQTRLPAASSTMRTRSKQTHSSTAASLDYVSICVPLGMCLRRQPVRGVCVSPVLLRSS